MSEEIIKVVDALAAKLGIAIDWTSANVMPYLQQIAERYIGYEIGTNIYWIVVWALVTIVVLVGFYVCYRKSEWKQYGFDDDSGWCYFTIVFGVVSVISVIIFTTVLFTCGQEIITCIMLPEKVVLDYLQGMM
jgi:heme/copper-type cytochrome/quinol oxidase subunit 2